MADKQLLTKDELKSELELLGVSKGMKILVHVALSKVGRLENGPDDLITALQETVTDSGIVAMPAYNCYGDYKPNLSIVNDVFRRQGDVICTNQLIAAFAVWGCGKEQIAASVPYTEEGLSFENGEKSTIARLYENDSWSLMIGTDYSTCTMLHLAENRANWPGKFIYTEEVTLPDGSKCPYHDVAYQDEDFNMIGKAFESRFWGDESVIRFGKLGNAECRLVNQRILVDYAVDWMQRNRK